MQCRDFVSYLLPCCLDKTRFVSAKQDGGALVSYSDVSAIVGEEIQPLRQNQQALLQQIKSLQGNIDGLCAVQKRFFWCVLSFLTLLLLFALYIILSTMEAKVKQEL